MKKKKNEIIRKNKIKYLNGKFNFGYIENYLKKHLQEYKLQFFH
jgi:hypothetical protein